MMLAIECIKATMQNNWIRKERYHFVILISVPLAMYSEIRLRDRMVVLFLTFEEPQYCFP